jgi:uncharacterized membrane protein
MKTTQYIFLCAFACLSLSFSAHAKEFTVCNQTSETLDYAYANWSGDSTTGWDANGWITLQADECHSLADLKGSRIYVHAFSEQGSFFEGKVAICTGKGDFQHSNAATIDCDQEEQSKTNFIDVPFDGEKTTFNFSNEIRRKKVLLCNETTKDVHSAIAYDNEDGESVTARGWYPTKAGECSRNLVEAYGNIYLFSESGPNKWNGSDEKVCVEGGSKFRFEDANQKICSGENLRLETVKRIELSEKNSFDFTFTEDNTTDIATIQLCNRTSEDISSLVGLSFDEASAIKVKGYYAVTANTCKKLTYAGNIRDVYVFGKESGVAGIWNGSDARLCTLKGDINDIADADTIACIEAKSIRRSFTKVEPQSSGKRIFEFTEQAVKKREYQLKVCNTSDKKVFYVRALWDATGFDKWQTRGWASLEAGACSSYINYFNSSMMIFYNTLSQQGNTSSKKLCYSTTNAFYYFNAESRNCGNEGDATKRFKKISLNRGQNTYNIRSVSLGRDVGMGWKLTNNGFLVEPRTNLHWSSNYGSKTWSQAMQTCQQDGMRLPNNNEVFRALDKGFYKIKKSVKRTHGTPEWFFMIADNHRHESLAAPRLSYIGGNRIKFMCVK